MYHINSREEKPNIGYMLQRVTDLMQRGIKVANLDDLYSKFESERDNIAKEITAKYGIKNPNSSQQLTKYLESMDNAEVYETCCIDGKWTSNKDALGNLALLGYEFASDILDYRKAKKYAESIKSIMDAKASDGKIHPLVSLSKTNRINYSSPALMNIPKPLLWHIITPTKQGNVLISADIKNQEPSILINILNADSLKPALTADSGLYEYIFSKPFKATAPLHIFVTNDFKPGRISNSELSEIPNMPPVYYTPSLPAVTTTYYNNEQVKFIDSTSIVVKPGTTVIPELPDTVLIQTMGGSQYHVPVIWENVDKKLLNKPNIIDITGDVQGLEIRCEGIERKEFKVAWNAMTYGASSFGVKQMCKHINGDIVYDYFSKIPEFKKYRSLCKKAADNGQQNIKTYFGTMLTAGESNPNRLRRILMDLPIQGTAADILSLLIMHVDRETKLRGIEEGLKIYYTRHDEIIFEASKDLVEKLGEDGVMAEIRDLVEHQVDDWTPFKVEISKVEPSALYIDDTGDDIFD